jgi:outer membrane protein
MITKSSTVGLRPTEASEARPAQIREPQTPRTPLARIVSAPSCLPQVFLSNLRASAPLRLIVALSLTATLLFSQDVRFTNSSRLHDLLRAGNLYLSLQDALALAIENNLDIELQRTTLPIGDLELQRARGGGVVRGLNYTVLEVPTGTGGPISAVPTTAAIAGRATAGTSIGTNALSLNALGEPQVNLSLQGNILQTTGTAVPSFDPALVAQLNWTHATTPQTSTVQTGSPTLITNTTLFNAGIQQGFASGASASLNFNNNRQSLNSLRSAYDPYTGSALGLNLTQPLLRGFGAGLNRRFIRIAGNERRITSLLFRQQLILTVYGVIRLYTDYVALTEDEKVKQETVALAEKLLSDVNAQVEEGTLAQVEKARANAQVSSTRQDLINARGLREEQEAILKNVLTRTGNADPEVQSAHIIPTDTLTLPATDEIRPMQDLIGEALINRPDLGQAQLQIANAQIGLEGSRNLTKPQLDLVGIMQNNGLAGQASPFVSNADPGFIAGYAGALQQIFSRNYPTYGLGVQLTLPLKNRVAESDLARDEIQVRQQEIRLRQLQNQARLEVEDALIAMRRARASYEAAVQSRALQQESLEAEQAKFEVGASTSFFVIQYESLLAQARSAEVAARSSYVKAKAALQRAIGTILDENNIAVDAAIKGKL